MKVLLFLDKLMSIPRGWFYYLRRIYRQQKALAIVKSHKGSVYIAGAGKGTVLTSNCVLGYNVNFNGMLVKGCGEVVFGDNFHSGEGCKIITQIHNYKGDALPYDTGLIPKNVRIGDNVWLGDNVIILGEVSIGEGAIIQAGSVVVKDIPNLAIAAGHPALPFMYRDKNHYDRLKRLGKFH